VKKVVVRPDGASRGNPGPAAIAVVVEDTAGRVLREVAEPIGRATNNVAEYRALLRGLLEAKALGAEEVEVCTDSELVARQLEGRYRVRDPELARLHHLARSWLARFRTVVVRAVPRSENARADALARRALAHGGPGDPVEHVLEAARRGHAEQARAHLALLDGSALRRVAERLVEEVAQAAREGRRPEKRERITGERAGRPRRPAGR
jgi:ribonuclease HI